MSDYNCSSSFEIGRTPLLTLTKVVVPSDDSIREDSLVQVISCISLSFTEDSKWMYSVSSDDPDLFDFTLFVGEVSYIFNGLCLIDCKTLGDYLSRWYLGKKKDHLLDTSWLVGGFSNSSKDKMYVYSVKVEG